MAKFKNEEQKKKWYKYNTEYSRKNYKSLCLKLSKAHDSDIITYLETNSTPNAELIKKLIREHMAKGQ